jgi:hypothetical protein
MQNLAEHVGPWYFFTMASSTSSTEANQDGKTTWRHWRKTNLQSQMFTQLDKGM